MRLSTFAKLVSAEWNRNNPSSSVSNYTEYLCITADYVYNKLKYNTNNSKLREQYNSHCQRFKDAIEYHIKHCSAVIFFLIAYRKDYLYSFPTYAEARWNYRRELLETIISEFKSLEELPSKS